MSDNIVEVTAPSSYSVSIETSLDHNPSVTIALGDNNHTVNVINNTTVLVSDLPQGYPLSWTVGDLPASRVSGLPVTDILGGHGINIQTNGSSFTVAATGLQPSGNYSIVGHSHYAIDILDFTTVASGSSPVQSVSGRQGDILLSQNDVGLSNVDNTSDLDKPISYAVQSGLNLKSDIGHQHVVSSITDFNSGVSGLLPGINGSGYVQTNWQNNSYIISVSGLQPTGNYSLVGHSHISNDITDFNAAVSGLLPVKNISAGAYANVQSSNQNFTISITGLQPSGNYALDSHVHGNIANNGSIGSTSGLLVVTTSGGLLTTSYGVSSNLIKDFQTSVSGLLPNISGVSGVIVTNNANTYFIGLSNPSIQLSNINDLSTNGRTFLLSPSSDNLSSLVTDETGSGLLVFNTSPNFSGIPTAPTASSGNNSTQIANTAFVRTEISNLVNSAPSTLDTLNELATALGNDPNFATTISSGLATKANLSGATFIGSISGPSGDFGVLKQNGVVVSVSGHSHVSNDITNFNSSVSGLLPVTNIIGGTNINVVPSGSSFTVSVSGQLGLTAEEVDDRVSNLLVAGTGITLLYDDNLNSLSIATTGLQPSGNYSIVGHTHTSSNITDFTSAVSGIVSSGVNTTLVAGTGISLEYYSNNDTLNISTSGVSMVGHKHMANEINDFNDAVKLIKLNDLAAPTGTVNFNSQRLINVGTAVSGTDGVNKNYIDNLLASTGTKGIASFDSGDFSVVSGAVSIKTSGIDNSQLVYSSLVLGSTTLVLGSTYLSISGLTIDGGSP